MLSGGCLGTCFKCTFVVYSDLSKCHFVETPQFYFARAAKWLPGKQHFLATFHLGLVSGSFCSSSGAENHDDIFTQVYVRVLPTFEGFRNGNMEMEYPGLSPLLLFAHGQHNIVTNLYRSLTLEKFSCLHYALKFEIQIL